MRGAYYRAGSGIGKSTAKLFSRAAKLALLGRDRDELHATAQRITGESCIWVADVAEPAEMESAVAQSIDKFGRLDVVVANAGINGVWAALDSLEPEEWNETIGVNLTGAFLTMKYAVPHLRKMRGNVIISHRSMDACVQQLRRDRLRLLQSRPGNPGQNDVL